MSSDRDKRIYQLAKNFLLGEFEKHGRNAQTLEAYLKPTEVNNLVDVYKRILESGKNAVWIPNVIFSGVGNLENLGETLFDFDYLQILAKYDNDDNKLYSDIAKRFKKIKDSERTWKRYSKTMLSGAEFLSQFKDYNDFDTFIKSFSKDERAQYEAAFFLKEKIFGFGLALSCDFLKELGYTSFGKPDSIVKRIFNATHLVESDKDYEILKAIGRVARNNNVTLYNVDKVFWLIGSSKLYHEIDPKTSKEFVLPGKKNRENRFIELAKLN